MKKKHLIVLGNGMVGYKFCEKLIQQKGHEFFDITVFGSEDIPAYDRVHLSEQFNGQTLENLTMAPFQWYEDNHIHIYLNEKVLKINKEEKYIVSEKNRQCHYDTLILATGSYAFLPSLFQETSTQGIFLYRTIKDLNKIQSWAQKSKKAIVVGGGLLGLEAANALKNLKLDTCVLEQSNRLMSRQLDQTGGDFLKTKIEKAGVKVYLNKAIKQIIGEPSIKELSFEDGTRLETDMVVVSAGIRPYDEIAIKNALKIGEKGGIIVNSKLQTSDENIYAIGECAKFEGMIYGLIAPGYKMADVLVNNLLGQKTHFKKVDLSTQLKFMGIDVASIGDPFIQGENIQTVSLINEQQETYKKIYIDKKNGYIVGGILVGDPKLYRQLLQYYQNKLPLPENLETLLVEERSQQNSCSNALQKNVTICSCENIIKEQIIQSFHDGNTNVESLKEKTQAGTGCGGCIPLIKEIIISETKKLGGQVSNNVCLCFTQSRVELVKIIKDNNLKTYWEVLGKYGKGYGCEICKPTIASILASYHNDFILEHQNIQETNDTFLANIQKNGSYSIIPRIPGGEIKADQLIALGEIAKKYDLYIKITGGQRIDLLGATIEQLLPIWETLRSVGLESGHAYAKSLRTVKSCVGSTWCRFGMQDSVGLAIRIENRYKGLRSPHKLKSAVSGCSRECAEVQSKDFGVIATEKGYNLYLCGNGGMTPRHADLLAEDLDEHTLIQYIDRFLMYYIRTADKLTRTSKWIETIEDGIEGLKKIIIEDSLRICHELEQEIQHQVDTYICEWSKALDNPAIRKKFKSFINTDEENENIRFTSERGQKKPLLR